jgi:hypothetical protein
LRERLGESSSLVKKPDSVVPGHPLKIMSGTADLNPNNQAVYNYSQHDWGVRIA